MRITVKAKLGLAFATVIVAARPMKPAALHATARSPSGGADPRDADFERM